MMEWSVLALCLAACGGSRAPEAPPAPAPTCPDPVPPPVERLAELAGCEPAALPAALPPSPEPPEIPHVDAQPIPEERAEEYASPGPKSVVELQPWRSTVELGPDLRLTDLHPRFHRQLILEVAGKTYNLENRTPDDLLVDLDESDATGLAILHLADQSMARCAPWEGTPSPLEVAAASGVPYVAICEDHLLLRNTVTGRRTTLEWTSEFLRTHVAGGDHITRLVKKVTRGRYRKDADLRTGGVDSTAASGPIPVALRPDKVDATVGRGELGLPIDAPKRPRAGSWHPVRNQPDVYAAVLAPSVVAVPDAEPNLGRVGSLDAVEGGALVHLVAFDLDALSVEFEVGTEHPAVAWSDRAASSQVDGAVGGPDGFETLAPLGRTGQVPPAESLRLVASFTGGFKREHSAFREGDLSAVHRASHYGVVQDGVIHSKLVPGLATLVVFADGTVDIRTWTEADDADLERILHARQNGVPILDSRGGTPQVSPLIADWRRGNWSGSATGETRTIRSGACIQDSERGRYLVYGYFTSATPRTLARVFLAAGCTDAIHLDMNALEHTYSAVYERSSEGAWTVHHLDRGMAVLDKSRKGVTLPRFVAFADNRDFFTLVARGP